MLLRPPSTTIRQFAWTTVAAIGLDDRNSEAAAGGGTIFREQSGHRTSPTGVMDRMSCPQGRSAFGRQLAYGISYIQARRCAQLAGPYGGGGDHFSKFPRVHALAYLPGVHASAACHMGCKIRHGMQKYGVRFSEWPGAVKNKPRNRDEAARLLARPVVLSHEPADFPGYLSYRFLSLSLVRLS